ncbi:MAG: ribose-phosphate diphosphokinase [Spirochaetales bacterium]|nr:ribose-phosphate diphosphokinase [Spirochaetales bacterium]
MSDDEILVFAGSGSKQLTSNICSYLSIKPARNEMLTFSEGNIFVRVIENVRGRHAYLVQSTMFSPNDKFMELLFWIDALRRASAQSITVIIPYFSYAKGDKKDEPRVSIRARVCADAIEAAGADRVVTMDLHAPQIQGFFRIPVDNLYGHPALCERFKQFGLENLVVVAPDTGFADEARQFANYLKTDVAIGDKVRLNHDEKAEILNVIGDVEGKNAVIVDDFVISGGTLVKTAIILKERGALRVFAMVTHGVFTAGSMKSINSSPIETLLITDTVEEHPVGLSDKVEVVSVAPYFAEAIRRIHHRLSISEMFP